MLLYITIAVSIILLPTRLTAIRVTQERVFLSRQNENFYGNVQHLDTIAPEAIYQQAFTEVLDLGLPDGTLKRFYIQMGGKLQIPKAEIIVQVWRRRNENVLTLMWTYTIVEYFSGPMSIHSDPFLLTVTLDPTEEIKIMAGDFIGFSHFRNINNILYYSRKDTQVLRKYWHDGVRKCLGLFSWYQFSASAESYQPLIGVEIIPPIIFMPRVTEPLTTLPTKTITTTRVSVTNQNVDNVLIRKVDYVTIVIIISAITFSLIFLSLTCYVFHRRRARTQPQITTKADSTKAIPNHYEELY